MMNKFKFPAIGISHDSIVSFKNKDDLSLCTLKAVREGYYNELLLIGKNGVSAKINKIETPKDVLEKLKGLFGSKIYVKIELLEEKEFSLDEVKQELLETIKRDEVFWESSGTLDSLNETIRSAKNYNFLVDLFF